ncbi:phosphotriesterase family protein [Agromyces italicus]|uniref:phosphotriesterase family protein n=1 Tax=Agromyces italicus TaxID=279572 RepID=UPI0003B5C555|nr:phosphotriesterase [Agromyces italicus]
MSHSELLANLGVAELSAIPNLEGLVQTVTGPVPPESLGPTLMHEHVFVDLRRPEHNPRPGWGTPESKEPLTLENLAAVRSGRIIEDNDVLGDFDEMLAEVAEFAHAGGRTMVEVTSLGIGRDARALERLSRASGLNIVMGGGWYEKNFHPADFGSRTVDELAAEIVRDVIDGVDGTGVRAGIIGEVGVEGNPLSDDELKSVRATGRAAALTGAPITFHQGGFGEEKLRVLDVLEEEGVDPRSVVFGHTGGIGDDLAFARRLLSRGVYVEADFLGTTGSPWGTLWPFTDRTTAASFVALAEDGWADQMLVGTDVCQRIQLKRYGGHGYTYVTEHFLPTLVELGMPDEVVSRIMVDNPARALTFRAPVG